MPDVVSVIAGGYSARRVDLEALPGTIIGVNDAGIRAPRVDIIVSMDRLWSEGRWEALRLLQRRTWLRERTLINLNWKPHRWLTTYQCDHRALRMRDASPAARELDGGHSGFVAMNLAYQLRPRLVLLVGFDMAPGPGGEQHWFPDYPWSGGKSSKAPKLAGWARGFDLASAQFAAAHIQVLQVGTRAIREFGTIEPGGVAACAG